MAKLFPTISWAKGASAYEVNIRQYTPEGTFAAFQNHLPRLQEMGVEILWLMPVTPISLQKRQGTLGSYYACSSYTTTNPEFGSLDDFKALVKEVHSRGMKLIIDWVANHTGPDHHWTNEHPGWYKRNEQGAFYDAHGWEDVIDLDYVNLEMRAEMIRSMKFWVTDCDIDGFRCDMAHLVPLDFWLEARSACDELKPLFWLAETDDNAYHDLFDATYAWSWMHKSEQFFRGHCPFHEFTHELKRVLELPGDCYKLMFTTNHDENSWNGTEYEKYGSAAKALAVLCCTFQSIPLVYSGQELPNLERLKFFDKDQLVWNDAPALHSFYKTLLNARKDCNALRYGATEILATGDDDRVLTFTRQHETRTVLVLLNFSASEKVKVTVEHDSLHGLFEGLFSGLSYAFENKVTFELDAWGWLVYRK
jgi:glycosidase